jgi:hypothetical protein
MPATQVRGTQVRDASIQRADIDTTTAGQALIAKAVEGDGIQLNASGVDAGTGDVTIALKTVIVAGVITQLYIGSKARLTALANGLRLEIQDSGNNWIIQNEWTE